MAPKYFPDLIRRYTLKLDSGMIGKRQQTAIGYEILEPAPHRVFIVSLAPLRVKQRTREPRSIVCPIKPFV